MFSYVMLLYFKKSNTTNNNTLSLHDALPIYISYIRQYMPNIPVKVVALVGREQGLIVKRGNPMGIKSLEDLTRDRKSTRLNSSHGYISYAVFCLKKKKIYYINTRNSSIQNAL